MLHIYKLRDDSVLTFAAEELKKYLRMMMPQEKVINITLDPDTKEGFRLGLLEDFNLPCKAEDPLVDDVIHIVTDEKGGILAGSNARSVLFAVYRYLKLNGCRFLCPGAEGEYIPKKAVAPQKYHKLADHRYRGHAIEGDPSLEQVLDYIDWHDKYAWEMLQKFYDEFGKYDLDLERWFDFGLWAVTMKKTVLKKPSIEL